MQKPGLPFIFFQMALKNVTKQVAPAYYRSPGEEVQPGDQATLFLNQDHNPNLPASIPATVLTVSDVVIYTGGCGVNGKSYIFQYDSAALAGEVNFLDDCDIVSASGTSCCEANATAIAELATAVEDLEEDLDTWDEQALGGEPVDGSPGVAQVETQTAVGTILTDGTVIATVTGAGITGSPLAVPVQVAAGDVPSVWSGKVAVALDANAAIAALYDASSIGADFGLTEKMPNGNDGTLNIAIANGTATGITPDATSVNTVAGVAAVAPVPSPERVGQHARWGNRIWEATSLYAWTELITERNGVMDLGYSNLVGGTAADMDSRVVTAADVDDLLIGRLAGKAYLYRLVAGTDATMSPYFIRPVNYAGGTNEVVWQFEPVATTSNRIIDASAGGNGVPDGGLAVLFGVGGTVSATLALTVKKPATAFIAAFGATNLTASRNFESPDASGTLNLQQVLVATTPATGSTITATTYVDQSHYITPAGTIATMTFTLPTAANSRVGQVVKLWFTQIVTTLTVNVSGGGTILGTALVAAVVNTPYQYECVSVAGTGTWTRRQ